MKIKLKRAIGYFNMKCGKNWLGKFTYNVLLPYNKSAYRKNWHLGLEPVVGIVCTSLMIWMFVYVKNALSPASNILLVEVNEMCVIHVGVWPYLAV